MATVFRIYLLLCRLIGVCNLHYDFGRRRFQLRHKPTLLYCIMLHATYVGLLPVASIMLIRSYYSFEHFNVVLLVNNSLSVIAVCAFLMSIYDTWHKRQQLHRLASGLVRLYRFYQQHIAALSSHHVRWKIISRVLLIKAVAYFSRLFILFAWIYEQGNSQLSGSTKAITYSLCMVYFGIQTLFMIVMDFNVCIVLLLANILLDLLQQQLQSVRREFELLLNVQRTGHRGWHKTWLRELTNAVCGIQQRQRQLKALIFDLFGIYQLQLLCMLASYFLLSILMIFRLLVELRELQHQQHYSMLSIIVPALVICLNFCGVMVLFFLCERIRRLFADMRHMVYRFWWRMSSNHCGTLERTLEQFSLELLQQPCQLNICGCLELSMSTGLQMARAIHLHLLILLQIVFVAILEMRERKTVAHYN